MHARILVPILLLFALAGCLRFGTVLSDPDLGSGQRALGPDHYLTVLKRMPTDVDALYTAARLLMDQGEYEQACGLLDRAAALYPQDATLAYWQGTALGLAGRADEERAAYERGLAAHPDDANLLEQYGHNLFDAGRYADALAPYAAALEQDEYRPAVLYNRAVALQRLKRTPEEIEAWRTFLALYPFGDAARTAADRLNALGDFSYRSTLLGHRRVSLGEIVFEPLSAEIAPQSEQSLEIIADVLATSPRLVLRVLVYQRNNRALAKAKALAIARALENLAGSDARARIRPSWFAEPESVTTANGKVRRGAAVHFYATAR